jgi:hypothetical protein
LHNQFNASTEDYVNVLVGNSEVKTAFAELYVLTREESLRVAAETLVAAKEIGDNVTACMSFTYATSICGFLILFEVRTEGRETAVNITEILELESEHLFPTVLLSRADLAPVGKEIRDWLDPPDPALNRNRFRKMQQKGTCQWLFDFVFDDWKVRPNGVFWFYGNRTSLYVSFRR